MKHIEERICQLQQEHQAGQYQRRFSDSEIDNALLLAVHRMDHRLQQALLTLIQFEPISDQRMDDCAFGVTYVHTTVPGHLVVYYNRTQLDIILRAVQEHQAATSLALDTIATLLAHELWHIASGDPFDDELLRRYANCMQDPIWLLAVECRINEGHPLNADECIYPLVTFRRLGIADRVGDYCQQHRLPSSWIYDVQQVHDVIEQVLEHAKHRVRVEYEHDQPVAVVVERTLHRPGQPPQTLEYRIPISPMPKADGDADTDGSLLFRQMRENAPGFHFDEQRRRFVVDPSQLPKRRGFTVQWSRILPALGVRRATAFNRRIGHLFPPDSAPLTSKKLSAKQIYAFIDSSASIDDELLAQLWATLRRSPYPVHVRYFHDEVTEKPVRGGTCFASIERYLQSLPRYPDVVIVLTDGQDGGPRFHPLHPRRWYWVVDGSTHIVEGIGGTVLPVKR